MYGSYVFNHCKISHFTIVVKELIVRTIGSPRSRSARYSILRDIPFTVIVVHDSGATSFGDGGCTQVAMEAAHRQRRVVQYGDDGVVVLWRRLPVASSASL